MAGSGKYSKSIVSSYSLWLLESWEKWDVRGMILFSLTLQIILSVLGRRRKFTINIFFKIMLWFAYLGADWIAIATLSKLSSSNAESPITNVLRAYWAPLLLLHLGGPDTITAYSFEDNRLWIRHLLILVIKAILVVYVISSSWTFSWLSFLSLPLILAGIIKYVEKVLCLKLNNSQKRKAVISDIFNPQGPQKNPDLTLDHLLKENPTVLRGYLWFTILRQDVNEYLSRSLLSAKIRIETYLKETTGIDGSSAPNFMRKYFRVSSETESDSFKSLVVELGFIFDVVYTKAALIYTKLGFLLRFTSFASCFSVLLLFLITIINKPNFQFSRVDISITCILLGGSIALEIHGIWVTLSSDWGSLVAEFHHNVLVRKMFRAALHCFPCFLRRSKRWSDHMGQFDLLEYCWRYKKKKVKQSCAFLRKMIDDSDIIEMWRKNSCTNFVQIPSCLMESVTYKDLLISFIAGNSFQPSRGEKALQKWQQFEYAKWSNELDFDYSIIIWHLVTSVFYYQDQEHHHGDNEGMKTIKLISDYMMHLLAMRPPLILPEHSRSFWLDHSYDKLKELLCSATDISNAASTLLSKPDEEELESSETIVESLQKDVIKLATFLKQSENKWEMIKDVWIEMLFYAAFSSEHISHIKQLGEGYEFLSLLWLLKGHYVTFHSFSI